LYDQRREKFREVYMRIRSRTGMLLLCGGLSLAGLISGCQKQENKDAAEEVSTEVKAEEPVEFISEDGSVSIQLPGESWKVNDNTGNLCMFSSEAGLIMLTKTTDAEIVIPESQEDVKKVLLKEGYNSENYEVVEYEDSKIADMTSYRTVIKYEDSKSPYIYGILYGTVINDREYMASAMLYTDNEEIVEQVRTSIYSFKVLKDEEALKPEEVQEPTATPTPEATPEVTAEATPEPTAEATPEPTAEATPEPVQETTPEPVQEPVAGNTNPVVGNRTCASAAYVRSGPDNHSPIIGTVSEGDELSVTGEVRNWYEISYGGMLGYVCKDYIH